MSSFNIYTMVNPRKIVGGVLGLLALCITGFSLRPTPHKSLVPDFQAFKKEFPKGNFPFSLQSDTLIDYFKGNKKRDFTFLSYPSRVFLPHAKQSYYSRLPVRFVPIRLLETADRVVAIYGQVRGHSTPTTFYITVLDPSGKVISGDVFAYIKNDEMMEAAIDAQLWVTKKVHRVAWSSEDYASAQAQLTPKRTFRQGFAQQTGKNGENPPKEEKIETGKTPGRAK